MPKINQEEYEVLKGLDDKWKWIARDGECNSLNVFSVKPIKVHSQWDYVDVGYKHAWLTKEENKMFQFIQWEDEEPYNIAELIEEYESEDEDKKADIYTRRMKYIAQAFSDLNSESEETEMKDNKLNGKTLNKILTEYFDERALSDDDAKIILDYHKFDDETLIELALGVVGLAWGTSGRKVVDILDDFDQLDEPETLSQEWIDSKKIGVRNRIPFHMDVDYAVPEEDLQSLLVPKKELPVIPRFVAYHIEECKRFDESGRKSLYTAMDSMPKEVSEWMAFENYEGFGKGQELFARAWLDGFTVEKENKYYARIKGWENVTTGSEAFNWVYFKEKDSVGISKAVENKYQAVSFTKYDWDNLGINEDNADFVLVEEL